MATESTLAALTAPTIPPVDLSRFALSPVALRAALLLLARFPFLALTSGRRDLRAQVHAMVGNMVVAARVAHDSLFVPAALAWLLSTYVDSPARLAIAQALRAVGALTANAPLKWPLQIVQQTAIESRLVGVLDALPRTDLAHLSRHLTGDAFDLAPLPASDPRAAAVIAWIKAPGNLPGLDKFLTREGGLPRWHLQFNTDAS